ncbi:polyketide cyclase [Halobacteriales archaeon QS_8_69_26]|nr:MAG: polyketide cyclase [Halobacteriales archaeon QS_8_69_26]
MHEVEVSGFVQATPTEVERALSPARIVEYEGSFQVEDVTETGSGWLVTVSGGGLEFTVRFEPREDGYHYDQEGGPLETMETTLTYEPEDEGTRVRLRSRVSMGSPPAAITDRFAGWKRRGELRRALSNLAADVE